MNDELHHHGILGMKWGIRRFQNYDGTLTYAGKKRLYKTVDKINKNNEKTNAANEERVYRNSESSVSSAKKQFGSEESVRSDSRTYRELSNEELKYAIEHYKLEQNYSNLINSDRKRDVTRGREEVREMLQTAGAVLAVGATAVGIAKTITEMKTKKGK